MTVQQFYLWYANLPLKDRFVPLDVIHFGDTTLSQISTRIDKLEELKRPYEIEISNLLQLADQYCINKGIVIKS